MCNIRSHLNELILTWSAYFKERYKNHNCSFRNKSCEKNIELSKYVWELKEKDINSFMNWDIAMKLQKSVCESRKFDLCICEKLLIFRTDPNVFLNKRDELFWKCRLWSLLKIDKIIYTIQCISVCNYTCFSFQIKIL